MRRINDKFEKAKTRSVLFGPSQRIAKQNESFDTMYRGSKTMNTTQHKFLGTEVQHIANACKDNGLPRFYLRTGCV